MKNDCRFSERFLQIAWNEQFLASELHCTDGRRLQIVSSGIWNTGAGPDFRNAAMLVDGRLLRGDVEIHRASSDWRIHGHHGNPAYSGVILHVVWQDDAPEIGNQEGFHTLEMHGQSSAGWEELTAHIDETAYSYGCRVPRGRCAMAWTEEDDTFIQTALAQAGLHRLRHKAQHLKSLCSNHNNDQVLYEMIFDALGYQNSRRQFTALAKFCQLKELRDLPNDMAREARLFGAAGLLPDPTRNITLPQFKYVLRDYWEEWWRNGAQTAGLEWPKATGRPFNSPQRRLQAGIILLSHMDYQPAKWLRKAMQIAGNPKEILRRLFQQNYADDAWKQAKDFCHELRPAAALLGQARKLDMAANIFLPYLLMLSGNNGAAIEKCWLELPKSQSNRLLTEATHRFFQPPSRTKDVIKKLGHQQGLLHIYKTFCLPLNHDCSSCPMLRRAPTD